jgi:hypothetical protein
VNKGVGGIEGRASLRRLCGVNVRGFSHAKGGEIFYLPPTCLSMVLSHDSWSNPSIAHLSDLDRPPQIFPIPDKHLPKCAGCGAQWDNHDTGCYCMWGREPSECEGPND